MKVIENVLMDHQEQLYYMAYRYLKNEDDALDAIQETAYKAIKYARKLNNIDYALTWITRILINTCLHMIEKNKRYDYSNQDITLQPDEFDFEVSIHLKDILASVNKKYREVIVLKHLEGYKISEIAYIYDKPEGTIKTWLKRGMDQLQSEVNERG